MLANFSADIGSACFQLFNVIGYEAQGEGVSNVTHQKAEMLVIANESLLLCYVA